MTDVNDLIPVATRLNAASDALTQLLQAVQDRLNALGIGLEVWLSESLGERHQLGYGRVGDGWGFLVRERGDTDDRHQQPLLRAPRALRFAAVPLIGPLLDAIKCEALIVIDRLDEAARQIAESRQ